MSAVPLRPAGRRVPYLLGGIALSRRAPSPRRALPALFLPPVRADRPLAAGAAVH